MVADYELSSLVCLQIKNYNDLFTHKPYGLFINKTQKIECSPGSDDNLWIRNLIHGNMLSS